MSTSSTSEDTIFPNAAPIITPTAKSTTFPRMAKSLNSFSTDVLLYSSMKSYDTPEESQIPGGLSVAEIIVEAKEKERKEEIFLRICRPTLFVRDAFTAAGGSNTRQLFPAARAMRRRPRASDQPRGMARAKSRA